MGPAVGAPFIRTAAAFVAVVAAVTVVVLGASGCATTASAPPGPVTTEPAQPEIPCNTDSECRGGVCRMGSCANTPASATGRGPQRCTFDSECPRGRCEAGVCLWQHTSEHMCNFDSDCPSGACRNGRCGPPQADFQRP